MRSHNLLFFKYFFFIIYLAMLGLRGGVQDVLLAACGIQFPGPCTGSMES